MRTKGGAIPVHAKCQRKFGCRVRKSVNCEFAFYRGSEEGALGAHNPMPGLFSAVAVKLS